MFDELLNTSTELKSTQKNSLEWKNQDNDEFYGDIGAEGLIKLSHKAGLFTGCDVKKFAQFWQYKHSVLDIGSGFGRVINALIDNGFKGRITGVERNHQLFNYTSDVYKDTSTVTLLNQDAYTYIGDNFDKKFGAIFMLWSGLEDYNPKEQHLIIKRFSQVLEEDGCIFIDTMPMGVQPLDSERLTERAFLFRSENNSIIRIYEPSYNEMDEYAKSAGLKILRLETYLTDTDRPRWLYVLTKSR